MDFFTGHGPFLVHEVMWLLIEPRLVTQYLQKVLDTAGGGGGGGGQSGAACTCSESRQKVSCVILSCS